MLDNEPTTSTDDDTVAATEGRPAPAASETPPADEPRSEPRNQPQDGADTPGTDAVVAPEKPARKTAAKKAAKAPAKKAAAKRTTAKKSAKAVPDESGETPPLEPVSEVAVDAPAEAPADSGAAAEKPKKKAAPRKKAAAKRVAAPEVEEPTLDLGSPAPAESDGEKASAPTVAPVLFKAPEPTTAPRKRTTRKVSASKEEPKADSETESGDATTSTARSEGDRPAARSTDENAEDSNEATEDTSGTEDGEREQGRGRGRGQGRGGSRGGQGNRSGQGGGQRGKADASDDSDDEQSGSEHDQDDSDDESGEGEGGNRRRRRRGGRRRRKPSDGSADNDSTDDDQSDGSDDSEDSEDSDGDNDGNGSRRRRRRRRTGDDGEGADDPQNTTTRVRKQRNPEDEITSIGGSTRLEAKKQRRREGREAGRRRAPIVSEAEFLARREAVDRVMVIRQKDDLTQIGVLEDKVLVEHYVARESQTSLIGNIYLGRVQNVLPSMEAAFVDIGKGRNAVLYAGEVNWSAVGHKDGQQRKIESVLSSGQTILVQVSKDPVGHKGARLTGQISLPGRFLVYVPDGNTSGISRKLPDTERNRLKTLLKKIVPESAGVIVRTAAEGASEEELTLDVERLTARWAEIEEKVKSGKSPQMLYGEPDLTLKVVRDLFTEDFGKLVVQGDDAWKLVSDYVSHVAPDLQDRIERYEPGEDGRDLFASYRVDEQIAKGLDRKVWLPSGGSLVIDRTEAMTVVDVNTGKFTGSGGNLEETVTKNNLEAAEEMVRQLRLRDIGGIIVIDFIDMVLESNRDLVLRRLVECLGRDRTRHQVAEVTSLGLVQMTRKRIGTGLVEAFSTECEACKGRGLVLHDHPVESGSRPEEDDARGRGRGRSGRNRGGGQGNDSGGNQGGGNGGGAVVKPSPADLAKIRPAEKHDDDDHDDQHDDQHDHQHGEHEASQDAPATEVVPLEAPADAQVEQAVIGKPAGISPEPQDVPSESASVPGAPRAEATVPEAVQTTTGTSTEEPPAPAGAPRVVRTTRRRTARRPAGPPTAPNDAAQDTAQDTATGKQSLPSAEAADIPVDSPSDGHAPESRDEGRSDEATQVTDPTSTPEPVAEPDPRVDDEAGAGASADPTWPTDESDEDDEGDAEDSAEDGAEDDAVDGDDEAGIGFSLVHVPVKRKGSRK
ncbi:MAG: RNAse, partial [Marmoricola sp.]|nr:RNAse [Marmoricola sp.]